MNALKTMGIAAVVATALTVAPARAENPTSYVSKALAEVEFTPVGDLPIEMAVLWGDPQNGESAILLKFPPNFPGGMHKHSHAYHGLVLKGGSRHWAEGESEADARLQTPGDYWYQKAGLVHRDSFPTDEETILFLQFEGPADTIFVK